MTYSDVRHNLFIWATRHVHVRDMIYSYGRLDSCICATWLIHVCDETNVNARPWHILFLWATWLIRIYNVTYTLAYSNASCLSLSLSLLGLPWFKSYSHASCIRATWMTRAYVQHDAFICATRRIHTRHVTHAHMQHDAFIQNTWLTHELSDLSLPFSMCIKTHASDPTSQCTHTHSHTNLSVRHPPPQTQPPNLSHSLSVPLSLSSP